MKESKANRDWMYINGVFGAVCSHGFPYHLIGNFILYVIANIDLFLDVPKEESLVYAVMIARKLNEEFPKAKLTIVLI